MELCDVFEAAFDRPARFSFARHAERLARILARFDRFTGSIGRSPGAGLKEATAMIQETAKLLPWDRDVAAINSLAYFLPILDEASKDRRRWWRRHHAHEWGLQAGEMKGASAKLGYDPKVMAAELEKMRRGREARGLGARS